MAVTGFPLFFSEVGKFFLCCGGQIFAFIPNFLDSAVGHPYSIYRLRYLQPRSILLCVCDAIAISENLDLIRSSFSTTFSVNTVISELDQLVLRGRLNCFTCCICETPTLDAILKSITFLTQEKWHYGILISPSRKVNRRLTNRASNRALNNDLQSTD